MSDNPYRQYAEGANPYSQFVEPQYKIGREGLPQAASAVIGEFNPLSQMAIGTRNFFENAVLRAKQLSGMQLTPEQEIAVQTNRAVNAESPMARTGDIAGSFIVPAASAYRAAGALLPKLLAPIAAAGTVGAATNTLATPVLQGESGAEHARTGALGGVIGDAILRGGARVAQPILQSPPVKKLLSEDIVPTIGQAVGGALNNLEQRLVSTPGIGNVISWARDRPVKELNRAAIQRAALSVTDVGRKGIAQANERLSNEYEDIAQQLTMRADQSFVPHLQSFADDPRLMLSNGQRKQIKGFINSTVGDNIANGAILGPMAKKIDSEMGSKATAFLQSSDPAHREMGHALLDAQTAFRQQMLRDAPPELAPQLADLNNRWANFVRLQKAAGTVGSEAGIFSAAQLSNAVRSADSSVRKGKFAKGEARMQDLSDAAKTVLGPTLPNSGSADRFILPALLFGANKVLMGAPYLTSLAASPLIYNRMAQRYLLGGFPGQPEVAGALRQIAPYGALAGARSEE